jgi:hypothetical protein
MTQQSSRKSLADGDAPTQNELSGGYASPHPMGTGG